MSQQVFVGGLHRSGTTLVARWLASASGASGFRDTSVWEDEGQHLQDVLLPARLLGGPGRFARHPAAVAGPVDEADVSTLRARLEATWAPLWEPGARVKVAKSPPNMLRGRLLQQLFPGALLVVVRRHPLAVALATRAMARRFRERPLAELVEHWVIAQDLFEAQRPHLGPHVVLDLAGLEEGMERCFREVGLRLVPPPVPLVDSDEKYRIQWSAVLRSRRFRRRELGAVAALAPRVRDHGYDLMGFEQASMPLSPSFSAR